MKTEIRNFKRGDEPLVLNLFKAADSVDQTERGMSANDLQAWMTWPGVNPQTDFFVAEAGGRPVGFAGVDAQAGQRENNLAYCGGVVDPDYRRKGVGTRLMQAAEKRATELMSGYSNSFPKYLSVFSRSTQPDMIALLESRGMAPARYFFGMQRDLTADLPAAPAPGGLSIRTYRPEDECAAHAAFDEAFRDHWNYEPLSLDMFRHEFTRLPHFRPDLWFLAWDGEAIAGFTFNMVDPEYMKRVGRQEGQVAEVGVRRAWRKRGLATALLSHSLHALRQAGMDFAILGVDAANPTGALSIYERAGFRELRRNIVYRKQLG
jgi:mycothiol synthase